MASTSANVDVSSIVRQLQTLKASDFQDEAARKSLFEAARDATFALETPGDTIHRITCAVLTPGTNITYSHTLISIPLTVTSDNGGQNRQRSQSIRELEQAK